MNKDKILFVDDDLNVLQALERTCSNQNWDIYSTTSAQEALKLSEEHQFSVVISDMKMPNMDGAEFLTTLSTVSPHTSKILLTGHSNDTDTSRAINHGKILNYLHKPWNNQDLIQAINDGIIYRKNTLNKLNSCQSLIKQNKSLTSEKRFHALNFEQTSVENTQTKNTLLANVKFNTNEETSNPEVEINNHRKQIEQDALYISKIKKERLIKEQSNIQLNTHLNTVNQLLSNIIQAHEHHSINHSDHVCEYAVAIAKAINLDDEITTQIKMASYLHDIGKLSLPDKVLSTPYEALSSLDLLLFQQHPNISADFLRNKPAFQEAALIIRQHHEYIDGSGYPNGLKDNNIHIGAKILSVCSDYDDILSGHLFSQKTNKKQTINYLCNQKGKIYNTQVCDTLITLIEQNRFNQHTYSKSIKPNELQENMMLAKEVITEAGATLLPKGILLNRENINTIKHFDNIISQDLYIHVNNQFTGLQ